jgi:probable rRNA maturation factor
MCFRFRRLRLRGISPGLAAGAGTQAIWRFLLRRRQAESFGHSLETEVRVLILHGALHLAGFDHEKDSGEMARREERLRRELGLPPGLIGRSVAEKTGRARAARKAGAKFSGKALAATAAGGRGRRA